MYLDPLDSPNLLRKISENTVIDGFGNHYELLPKKPGSPISYRLENNQATLKTLRQ